MFKVIQECIDPYWLLDKINKNLNSSDLKWEVLEQCNHYPFNLDMTIDAFYSHKYFRIKYTDEYSEGYSVWFNKGKIGKEKSQFSATVPLTFVLWNAFMWIMCSSTTATLGNSYYKFPALLRRVLLRLIEMTVIKHKQPFRE